MTKVLGDLFFSTSLSKKIARPLQTKYFCPEGEQLAVIPTLRNMITFKKVNLVYDRFPLKNPLDIIFCRNVLIYFKEEEKRKVIEKFHQALKPTGLLITGHSESLLMHTNLFKSVENTVYQRLLT